MNVATNWDVVFRDNARAIHEFIEGASIRSVLPMLKTEEARSELYRLEKIPVTNARVRARRAVNRRK